MELSSIITGLVVAALIIVPFFLMAYYGNKDIKLLEKEFLGSVAIEGLTISNKEKVNNTLIGFDNIKNKVLFVRVTSGKAEIKLINLAQIKAVSFVCSESHHKIEVPQKSAYFSFLSIQNESENKVFIYNSIEHKPIELAEILKKGGRWEELLKKKLDVLIKPKSPNIRRSA